MQLVVGQDRQALNIDDTRPDAAAVFDMLGDKQFQIALEMNEAPESMECDLALQFASGQLAAEIQQRMDDCHESTDPVRDDIMTAFVDADSVDALQDESLARIKSVRDEWITATKAARHARDVARGRRRAYEIKHGVRPEWNYFYDKVLPTLQYGAIGLDLAVGTALLVLSADVKGGGIETVFPALALFTYLSVKLGFFVGKATFRWRRATRLGKMRLAISISAAGSLVVGLQSGLGFLRAGLAPSLQSIEIIASNVLHNLGAITVTGIGIALFAFIAASSNRKLARGYTDEYFELRKDDARSEQFLAETEKQGQRALDDAHEAGIDLIDCAIDDAEYLEGQVREARRSIVTEFRDVRRNLLTSVRSWDLRALDYCQRFMASWPGGPNAMPSHYRCPASLRPDKFWDSIRYARYVQGIRNHLRSLSEAVAQMRKRVPVTKSLLSQAITSARSELRTMASIGADPKMEHSDAAS